MKTTPERLDELERLYLEYADCLDASSYDIEDLLHDAREAHRMHTPRRYRDWHEDYGPALWCLIPVNEPPHCGTPDGSDWPYDDEDEDRLVWVPLPSFNAINDSGKALLASPHDGDHGGDWRHPDHE